MILRFLTKNVIKFETPENMLILKEHTLEKLNESNGIIKIYEVGENLLLNEYLILTKFLLENGIFNKLSDIITVIKSMMDLLDGSNDF